MNDALDRTAHRADPSRWSASSAGGMVASAHYRATAIGAGVLRDGGNAIDAAVAVSVALGVCEPAGSGLGGMGLMMLRLPGESPVVVEGSCVSPARATPEGVAASPSRYDGFPAVAVPRLVALLADVHARHGSTPLTRLLEPAAAMAEEGFLVTPMLAELFQKHSEDLADLESFVLERGARLRQPALARTLRRLGRVGFEDFYTGEIGRRILDDVAARGGWFDESDFASLPAPQRVEPLTIRVGGLDVFAPPPPGGGIALLEMLRLDDAIGEACTGPTDAVRSAAIIQRARRDRRDHRRMRTLGVDGPNLIGADYARSVAPSIRERIERGRETTHFVVVDTSGTVVSMTQSIERSFGARVTTPDLGFLYNGFMRAFKVQNKAHPHYVRPGAVARSNASPTIVLRDGVLHAALGATGSERAASALFRVLRRLDPSCPFEAVHAPRLHCKPDGVVLFESRLDPADQRALVAAGFELEPFEAYDFRAGGLQLVSFDGTAFHGVADPRRDGAAAGPEEQR